MSNKNDADNNIFFKQNLIAWCIIPFDAIERTPEQRAAMLARLGFKSFAWDWRWDHRMAEVDQLETEVNALNMHGIKLKAVWFWVDGGSGEIIDPINESILKKLEMTGEHPQIWVSFPAKFFNHLNDQEKLEKAIRTIAYIREKAEKINCKIALYNHGDWFGQPKNMVRIIEALNAKNKIGIVYNFHHAHSMLAEFENDLKLMIPYLWVVNLNGMKKAGPKILPIGKGDLEMEMMEKLKKAGFEGNLGILGHRENEDMEIVLKNNLLGLKKVLLEMGESEAAKTY